MRCFVLSIVNVCFLVAIGFFFSDKICMLHRVYTSQSSRIADESWLRVQCMDPIFFANLKSHTMVCSEVEDNFRVGAFWFALAEVSESLPFGGAWAEVKALSFPVLATTALVLILFPSAIVSLMRLTSSSGSFGAIPLSQHAPTPYSPPHYPVLKQV